MMYDVGVVVLVVICLEVHGGLNSSHSVNTSFAPVSTKLPKIISLLSVHVQDPPTAVGLGQAAYFQPALYHTI